MLACHAGFCSRRYRPGPRRARYFAALAASANSATATAAPLPTATTDLTKEISLVSHRAVYELTLLKSVGSKSPTAAHGRIAFDFTGSVCDGDVENSRQLTELHPPKAPPVSRTCIRRRSNARRPEFRLQIANKQRQWSRRGGRWKSLEIRRPAIIGEPRQTEIQ